MKFCFVTFLLSLHYAVVRSESCDVSKTGTTGLAVPAYDTNGGYQTYSCHVCPQKSCLSEVHMLALYEPEGSHRGFRQKPRVVPNVHVSVTAGTEHQPLTFVLSTYEAANWVINVPDGVTVAHVFLMSYYRSYSSVKVLAGNGAELMNYRLHLLANKYRRLDYKGTGGRGTSAKSADYIAEKITSQYGCFTSFSGRYVTKSWTLNLDKLNTCDGRENYDYSDSQPKAELPATATTSAVLSPEEDIKETSDSSYPSCGPNPCLNGARCMEMGFNSFVCLCEWPFYGKRCENVNQPETCVVSKDFDGMATSDIERDGGYKTYGCAQCGADSCENEVHMIAMYEPEGRTRRLGDNSSAVAEVEVEIETVSTHPPLTLVLSSYEPTKWIVKNDETSKVAHVLLMSYHQSDASVKVLDSSGKELNDYELHNPNTPHDYMDYRGVGAPPTGTHMWESGCISCKGIDDVSNMTSEYGCFASFSGRYVAKSWTLNLDAFCHHQTLALL